MNIKISYHWLLEYLETDADPYDLQKFLSLSGPSVEKVEKKDNDYIFDIEIASNRIDTASVFGIAQEALAILPLFGKKAKLKINPLKKYQFKTLSLNKPSLLLKVKIVHPYLCSRFTAIILDNIKIKPSPNFIKERLTACGVKSINNVVDISNYLMISLGQPVHIFDYDKINKATMIMRESKKDEKIVTLDGKKITLPGKDIVIEDGRGELIDLCGIMGGLNSAVTSQTKRIVLFVQTYNKQRIRQTSMLTGQRTLAATYFEKGLDEERVEPTLVYGVELLKKYAQGKIASTLYDIYPNFYKGKVIEIKYQVFEKLIGIKIDKKKINQILVNLGFEIYHLDSDRTEMVRVKIPSYRKDDINIPEDLVEEIARIYGYHNLPIKLPPPAIVHQPEEYEKIFTLINKIKYFLKHLGLNEVVNYSMVSKKMIENFNLKTDQHLRLANTISKDIEYMRITLLPSLLRNIDENKGKKEILKFFEIAKVYLPRKNDLPKEIYKLAIAVNTDFFDLKGIIEALYKELNIDKEAEEKIIEKDGVYLVEIDLKKLMEKSRLIATYQPINPYAIVKLDLTIKQKKPFEEIKKLCFKNSNLLIKIEFITLYKNNLTLRFYFSSSKKNITEEEAKEELVKLQQLLSASALKSR